MSSPKTGPAPELIEHYRRAIYPSLALLAGMQLDLFTPLQDGPLNVESLAVKLDVNPTKLQPLLYSLVTAGLLTVEGERFANTPESDRYLVRGRPDYLGEMHYLLADLYRATLLTAESIRDGAPRAKHDFANMPAVELKAYFQGLHPGALGAGRQLVASYDLSRFHRLMDAGGGSGGLAIAACEACPQLQATVVELPAITPITEHFIAEAGMADQVQVLTANLVDTPPRGTFDVAVLRHFIQTLSTDQAQHVIHHVGQVLEPNGMLCIIGYILNKDRISPPEAATFNLVFLNLYDAGQAYTEQEYCGWLTDAGFINIKRRMLSGGHSIIVAHKPPR